jgi:hypothetical protein
VTSLIPKLSIGSPDEMKDVLKPVTRRHRSNDSFTISEDEEKDDPEMIGGQYKVIYYGFEQKRNF